jgi:hypothetical protein
MFTTFSTHLFLAMLPGVDCVAAGKGTKSRCVVTSSTQLKPDVDEITK